jgi:REP element-mobilizing transposase RayT
MSRGNRREDIFRDDLDRESFLQTLADTCAKTAWQVHAFCLMPNHFHLVVETPQPNLVAGMKWFLGTYTARFNRRHKLTGHVFAGRYKSLLVGGEGGYLRTVCDYVHLNPVRAKLLPPEAALRSYRWSSFKLSLLPPGQRPGWLRVDRMFGECGVRSDSAAGRQEFERRLETRRHQESEEELRPVRRGWCFGDKQFRQELLAQVEGGAGPSHYGAELQEAAEAKATRIIDEELRRAVWTEADLRLRKKGDPAKIQMARRLRAETTVTLQWITTRLRMGSKGHLSHLLYWQQRAESGNVAPEVARRAVRRSFPESGRAKADPQPSIRPDIPNKLQGRSAVENRQMQWGASTPTVLKAENNALPRTDPSADRVEREFKGGKTATAPKTEKNALPLTDPSAFDPSFD